MNYLQNTTKIIVLLSFIFPLVTFGMSINTIPVSGEVHMGDSSLVRITIDTDQKEINVVEGTITFDGARVVSASTGGSVLELWPKMPSIDATSTISFVGGTPSGVFGKTLTVCTVALTPLTEQPIIAHITNAYAYVNDGAGTKVKIPDSEIKIPLVLHQTNNDSLTMSITNDTTPPQPFIIELGREASVYNGRYFISFFTTDSESGVRQYEINENGILSTTTKNTYILQNQELKGTIRVTALDMAGNTRTEEKQLPQKTLTIIVKILSAFFLSVSVVIAFMQYKKKHHE